MELFEFIRKDYHHHQKSIRHIARERRVHRRLVRQAIANAHPPERQSTHRPYTVLQPAHRALIEQWVVADQNAPRKQRHTGERVYQRLRAAHGYTGSVVTARQYFYQVRRQLQPSREVFVPQQYDPGKEAEVDWYEAQVDFPTGRETVCIFQMRACYSGKAFHRAYRRQTQQSFLDAHVAAFDYFGGVFPIIRYDNLTAAVKRVLRGRQRIESERFTLLRSHYLFDAQFCLPGIKGAHEKGGVEGEVGRFRRAHLVPVPTVASLDELNTQLMTACQQDDNRTIHGQSVSIGERWQHEPDHLLSLPSDSFDTAEVLTPRVNNKSLITVKGCQYSVPTQWVGQSVEARVLASHIEVTKQGRCIARHLRSHSRHQLTVELDHYLELLRRKPGALAGSVALAQAKQADRWPNVYDQYWAALTARYETSEANRRLVDWLWWARDLPTATRVSLLENALHYGSLTLEAIQLLQRQRTATNAPQPLDVTRLGSLARYDRPPSQVTHYDQLLTEATG